MEQDNSPSCLSMADYVVSGNRRNDYGTPLDNHSRTARLWSAYLGHEVSPEDVCMLNILQKISRGMHSITFDTLVDICGYARNIELIQEAKKLSDFINQAPKPFVSNKDTAIPSGGTIPCCGVGSDSKKMREVPDFQAYQPVPSHRK